MRGAHTYGFNGDSAGIAVLGDFEGAAATSTTPAKAAGKPTRAALESVARVAAWKLGQYGGNPSGQVTLTAAADTGVWKAGEQATLNTISGHRDGFATACPGKNLYSKLSEIRRYASSPGKNAAVPTADFNRDGISDVVAATPKQGSGWLTLVPGGVNGPVSASKVKLNQGSAGVPGAAESGDQWGTATAWGDINADGYADLAIGAPGEDDTTGHADRGAVTILYGPKFDTGADTMALGDDYEPAAARFGCDGGGRRLQRRRQGGRLHGGHRHGRQLGGPLQRRPRGRRRPHHRLRRPRVRGRRDRRLQPGRLRGRGAQLPRRVRRRQGHLVQGLEVTGPGRRFPRSP